MFKARFALLCSLLWLSLACHAAADNYLRLAATEWPPYTSSNLPGSGLAAEIVAAAFRQVGYRVEYVVRPWLRAQRMVQNGELDGMGIAWYTDERAATMAYSRPFLRTEIVLIKHRDDDTVYDHPDHLNNKHFSVLRGYGYLNLVQSESIRTTVLDNLEQSFEMLASKRIDLTLEEKLNAQYRLSFLAPSIRRLIAFAPRPLEVKDLHITISRKHPHYEQIIADFNRGLGQIIADGSYQALLQSYQPRLTPLGVLE